MRGFNQVEYLYRQETGNEPAWSEHEMNLSFYRSRDKWILNEDESENIDITWNEKYASFYSLPEIPDLEYIEWLENKVLELMNNG